jgi:hypothetical protein
MPSEMSRIAVRVVQRKWTLHTGCDQILVDSHRPGANQPQARAACPLLIGRVSRERMNEIVQ